MIVRPKRIYRKRIPYGMQNFEDVIKEDCYYVDKSPFIEDIEDSNMYFFFIRPRRFGKSLTISMLENYYDINKKDKFEESFGELYIGKHPTPNRNKYLVLTLNFSSVASDMETLKQTFNTYCKLVMSAFAKDYSDLLGKNIAEELEKYDTAAEILGFLCLSAKSKGLKIYLILDEYDNFANNILVDYGNERYHSITHGNGFFRGFLKVVKDYSNSVIERIFLTGVSPVTMDDLTSGFNIADNYSSNSIFNNMIGFNEYEVRDLIDYYKERRDLPHSTDELIEIMKPWYDNYCFARMSLNDDRVFNCDMTLYYLRSQIDFHRSPEDMVDKNIRTDYSKLKMLARIDHDSSREGSRMSTIEEIAAKGEILVNLHTSFPAERIVDIDNFRSLLYYYGLLTICGTRGDRLRMCIPNHCVREQYFGFLRDYYQQIHPLNLSHLKDQIDDLVYDGHWKPFFESIASAYHENSSIRDGMEGERNLQGFLKAYLALASYYLVEPELEMNYGYCDFFLLPDKQRYPDIEHSYILELKYAARTATDAEGRRQLHQYSEDKIARQLAKGTTLHRLLLQFRGWEMLRCEEI